MVFIKSGELYRAYGWAKAQGYKSISSKLTLTISDQRKVKITLGGEKIDSSRLQTEQAGKMASEVARCKPVRATVTTLIRNFVQDRRAVVEGRDIGTVVLPSANLKVFLKASLQERARRRWKQLSQPEASTQSVEEIKQALKKRDSDDQNRELAPLRPAKDAHIIDTTELSLIETLNKISQLVEASN